MSGRLRSVGAVLALLLLAALGYLVSGTGDGATEPVAPLSSRSGAAAPTGTRDTVPRPPGMAVVALAQLPAEARRTVELIDRGGPFPYRQDDTPFGNRERLLPAQRAGYYREYTVPTPGSDDRGARRLVRGEAGELFYTDDHYASFALVRR